MIRKNLSLVILAILVALTGTACKKNSGQPTDDKSYLVNPNDTTKPGSKPPDPCLKKGALGVQAFLAKADCEKVDTSAKLECGNGITEKSIGEECDDGPNNGKSGNKCNAKCKLLEGTTPQGGGDALVEFKAVALPTAFQGEKYSFTLNAACKPAPCQFSLPKDGAPKSFEVNSAGKLSSTKVEEADGSYSIKVTVQNKDGSKSVTQDFSLAVKTRLTLRAFVDDMNPGGHVYEATDKDKDQVINGNDNDVGDSKVVSSGAIEVGVSGYNDVGGCVGDAQKDAAAQDCRPEFGYLVVGVNLKDPADSDLSAASDAVATQKFKWLVRDSSGKEFKSIVVRSGYSVKQKKDVDYLLLIGPDPKQHSYYEDLVLSDVKVSVADEKGNTSELILGKVIFKRPAPTAAEVADQKKTAEANDPCNIPPEILIEDKNGKEITGPVNVVLDDKVELTIKVKSKTNTKMNMGTPMVSSSQDDGTGPFQTPWDISGVWISGEGKYTANRQFRYGKRSLSSASVNDIWSMEDKLTVSVFNKLCSKTPKPEVKKELVFKVSYPELSTASLGDKIAVTATIGASDTNNDVLTLAIMGEGDKYFYAYLNNNNGWQLDDVGDNAPDSCYLYTSYGVSQKCPVSGTLNIYTAGNKADSDMKKAYLHANAKSISTDGTSDLDVWIHTIKVQGKYWEAEYGDGADSFTKEKANITENNGDSYPWSADGPLPWKRRAVPDYDGK